MYLLLIARAHPQFSHSSGLVLFPVSRFNHQKKPTTPAISTNERLGRTRPAAYDCNCDPVSGGQEQFMQATSAQPDLTLPREVTIFCEKRNLLSHLGVALRLAARLFDVSHDPRVTLETDPETDEQSVVIDIAAPMEVDEAVERVREYTRQWVQSAPPDVLGLIRLVPDISQS
jgi:hypothetical protein